MKARTWDKLHFCSLCGGFLLYLVDLGTDVYLAIQHNKNGDVQFFVLTVFIICFSTFVVNVHATEALLKKDSWDKQRCCAWFTHCSMILLFIKEICRCRNELYGDKALPCNTSQKNFSECDCDTCKKQLKESVEASLQMSYVRAMEAFIEAVPQWVLQVYVMFYKQSYPWYAILSVTISFLSILVSIYSLEKNFWICLIVNRNENYIRPVSFPKRSAVVFVVWQTFLLLGRLSAIVGMVIAFSGMMFVYTGWHWIILGVFLTLRATRHVKEVKNPTHTPNNNDDENPTHTPDNNDHEYSFGCRYIGMLLLSSLFMFPLIFHVSHSSYVIMQKNIPGDLRCASRTALIGIPLLFLIFHGLAGIAVMTGDKKDELQGWYISILVVYVLAFFCYAIFYSSKCHPVEVTDRKWEKLQNQASVERGTDNDGTDAVR